MTDFNERIAELAELGNCARKGSLVCDTIKETAVLLLREMQTENERLRQGIKDIAEKYAEMEKLRSQFYTEKEQAETALLFANRERDTLQARVNGALAVLKSEATYYSWMIDGAIEILTGEGE